MTAENVGQNLKFHVNNEHDLMRLALLGKQSKFLQECIYIYKEQPFGPVTEVPHIIYITIYNKCMQEEHISMLKILWSMQEFH